MPDPASPPATPDADAARRQREHVQKLLDRAPARSSGHVMTAGGRLDYDVHAAFMPVGGSGMDGAAAEPEAAVLTIAYLKQDDGSAGEPPRRPLCFAFNGGPGSSSIWLHFGALGPKRIVVPDDGSMPAAPYLLSDNPHTWLEHFDLVFIDPPHTGWSCTAGEAARKKMLGVDGDIEALAEVIRAWITRHRRWYSPLYLAGESYGTTRGAGIADKLSQMSIALSGLVLVSCAMDLQSIVFAPANDLPFALFLPGFANTSQYHGLLKGGPARSPEAARAAAEDYVQGDYAAVLQAGARLSDGARAKAARRIAELTGLPRALVEEKNLRISDQTYFFEALRPRGQIVGRLESRATGPMAASRTRDWEFDPGIEAIAAPYAMAAQGCYAEIGLDLQQPYKVLNIEVNRGWNWQRGESSRMGFASTSPDLARALRRNPQLRVLVASGRYDLGTPYSASDWSLARLDIPAELRRRVQHRYYDAGHMMYTRQADLAQMKADLAAWLAG